MGILFMHIGECSVLLLYNWWSLCIDKFLLLLNQEVFIEVVLSRVTLSSNIQQQCSKFDIEEFLHVCQVYFSSFYIYFLLKYSQTCNMDRAEALVREMEEAGIDAPIDIYHTMMDGYTMVGDEDKCLIVFERLKVQDQLKQFSCQCYTFVLKLIRDIVFFEILVVLT